MNPAYNAYFRNRLQAMQAEAASETERAASGTPAPDPRALLFAQGAVEHAQRTMPGDVEMRADAEMLLYLLASEFVAKPVLALEPSAGLDLADDLAADAAFICERAARRAHDGFRDDPGQRRPEVSAHVMVEALSESWSELRSARWRVWDRRGRDGDGPGDEPRYPERY